MTDEKLDAQRYLKYHDNMREIQRTPKVNRRLHSSQSEPEIPLFKRYDQVQRQHKNKLIVCLISLFIRQLKRKE